MMQNGRNWRVVVGGLAAATAAVVSLAGGSASAEPILPPVPAPAPATVTQTVTVAPASAPLTQLPSAAVPGASTVAAPGLTPAAPPLAYPSQPVAALQEVLVPASSGTLSDFLSDKGVTREVQNPRDLRALAFVLPVPRGWAQVPDPNVPDPFWVIADRSGADLYTSNAQLIVYKLIGDFDPKEAIAHGFIEQQQLPAWQATDASLAEYGGFPSSIIEGTYRENQQTLNTSRRHIIAMAGPDKYLVTLAVTTSVNQVVAAADATDTIVNGFRVTVPGAAPPPSPPGAPGLPAPLTAVPVNVPQGGAQ